MILYCVNSYGSFFLTMKHLQ